MSSNGASTANVGAPKQPAKNVLFVDDSQEVLESLSRGLRKYRSQLQMTFARGAAAALAELANRRFDAVISDVRMPEIDGVAFLRKVRESHPEAIRIVLSGQSDAQQAQALVYVAHQFLAKPCDTQVIFEVIHRSCELQSLLAAERIRKVIGKLTQLPSQPRIHRELCQALTDPNVSLKEVAKIVGQDSSLCAKILQIVNSAFFGLPQRMVKIDQAVFYLGFDVIKGLALSLEVFSELANTSAGAFDHRMFQLHAIQTGQLAKQLVADPAMGDSAFIAGMLHDLGQVVLATQLADEYAQMQREAADSGCPPFSLETRCLGATHAEVGAYLLGLWGLPKAVVDAANHHHRPMQGDCPTTFDVTGAVHVASALVSASMNSAVPIDGEYLSACGVASRLGEWMRLAGTGRTTAAI